MEFGGDHHSYEEGYFGRVVRKSEERRNGSQEEFGLGSLVWYRFSVWKKKAWGFWVVGS